jgi:ribonuclease E
MSDTPAHDDHWRRLAAELGLDVGPEPEQPPPATEPEPPEAGFKAPPPREEPEPPRSRRRREEPVEEPAVEEPIQHFDVEAPSGRGRRGRPAPVLDEPGLFEADEAPAAEAEIEGSDVEAAAVPEVRPEAAEEASEEVGEEQGGKRRRRRRPRRKKKGEPGAEADAVAPAEGAPTESATEPDDDDIDEPAELAANWNVPSWDELIGSLYRPER